MPYKAHLFGGPLLTISYGTLTSEDWDEFQAELRNTLEAGVMASVLHTDFAVPEERQVEMVQDVIVQHQSFCNDHSKEE
jgi:hypothetical protein